MELSPRTLVFPILLLSFGFLALLTTSVLAFFEIFPQTTILYAALASVSLMFAGICFAFFQSFSKRHFFTTRRHH